ncbi:MAG: acetyl-CoA carboxylase biotin carboxylase subunit [Hyphomicrobiaceae bacterium]
MSAPPFKRVLVANRGEIAVRIIRACKSLGIETVAAVSAADRDSMAARMATRTICIGPPAAKDSYLRADTLVTAAKGAGCEAVHPGYGFLSERSQFARLCEENGIVFIGPSPSAIAAMGDKLSAVSIAEKAGVPRVPGSGRLSSAADATQFARQHGYPILIKASAGGGGRGMRVVRHPDDLAREIDAAAAEAQAAFGDPSLYAERFIERARHIEIQILGDNHGTVVHLGERDCSTQRRHQKLIEEAPSPVVDAQLREELAGAAVRLGRAVGYSGAGTVEFVFDEESRAWYFLEMNTRIQVEHPVTEMITGRDLVAAQICIAAGRPLSFTQDDIRFDGHAIECRINAEDAMRNFAPGPGRLATWVAPVGAGVRVDTHCYPGYLVPPYYDSLLAKVIAHGHTRAEAIERMRSALQALRVEGVPTTAPFHLQVLGHEDFKSAAVTTRWVETIFMPQIAAKDAAE